LPWKATNSMDERAKLVHWYETGKYTIKELAVLFEVSRKTVYKWLGRYEAAGLEGLTDHSRAPLRHPNAVPPAVVAAVVAAKRAHPTWGPVKLLPPAEAPDDLAAAWPAVSTRAALLDRYGLVQRRRHRRRAVPTAPPLTVAMAPNDVWCTDFKGWFRTGDGHRCDPSTVQDAYSRMLLGCDVVARPDAQHVRPIFERLFRTFGLPLAIRSDNGPPYASVGVGGLTVLAVWWVKLGIRLERIAPGHPEQNGRLERLHRTLKAECCQPPAATLLRQQQRFDGWRPVYNTERPHAALGNVPPATLYTPSLRPFPTRLEDPQYAAATAVRRVRSNGQIRWQGGLVYVSEALVGEAVGLNETATGWSVHFGPMDLGLVDPQGERVVHHPDRGPKRERKA